MYVIIEIVCKIKREKLIKQNYVQGRHETQFNSTVLPTTHIEWNPCRICAGMDLMACDRSRAIYHVFISWLLSSWLGLYLVMFWSELPDIVFSSILTVFGLLLCLWIQFFLGPAGLGL